MNENDFEALANERRRDVLRTLQTESPRRVDALGGDSSDRSASLVHVHLPMLDDAGFVVYDRERGVIERGPRFDDVDLFLETVEPFASDVGRATEVSRDSPAEARCGISLDDSDEE